MKKIMKLIAVLLLISLSMEISMTVNGNVTVNAAEYEKFQYSILPDGTIEITKYNGRALDVVIPEKIDGITVTSIAKNAFNMCLNTRSITIPAGVTNIEPYVFIYNSYLDIIVDSENQYYTSLDGILYNKELTKLIACTNGRTSVNVPESVTQIGEGAFDKCTVLKSITLPDNLTNIGTFAFYDCTLLQSITIPGGVIQIGNGAFGRCENLKNIVIPEGVTTINSSTFEGCKNLENLTLPESLTEIGYSAFVDCNTLRNITIPAGVTKMESSVFRGCTSLTQITNQSTYELNLEDIRNGVQWYDTVTGEPIDKLSTGTAVALQGPVELEKSDVILDDNAQFVDSYGSVVDINNVVIIKSAILQKREDILQVVEEITQNTAEKSKEFYYNISAYNNVAESEPLVLNGTITLKLKYPAGVTKDDNIIVLHDTSRLKDEDINKYGSYFTLKTDSLGAFTVIALEPEDPVHAFVNRLYTLVLAREADEIGLESWTDALIKKKSNGVDIGYGFVFSDECKEKNLSNEDFVEILYNTFMNRPSDEGGKASWVSQLDAGVEREKVFAGFIYSVEFVDICSEYKIEVGNVFEVGRLADALAHYRNQNADITKFVARCYTEALGREYEPDGLEAWCKVIIEKSNTPKQAAQSFIFSDEFLEKNLNNEEYVKVLYRTFMGREADEVGLTGWIEVLESGREDRMKVMEGFSDSVEFDGILRLFGLN